MERRSKTPGRRRIHAPLERFLPNTAEERRARIEERIGYRARAYLAKDTSPEWKRLRCETDERRQTVRSEHTVVSIVSRKKEGMAATTPGMQAESERLRYRRLNEDNTRAGKNWYVLADGVSAYQRNVCALMGESVGIVMEHTVEELESREPLPDAEAVAHALRGVLGTARDALSTVLQQPDNATAILRRNLVDTDFSTTVEIVYYAAWLQRAFVVHVGDSRTYKQAVDFGVRQLTRDHVAIEPRSKQPYIGSTLSTDAASQKDADVFSEPLGVGERMVSVTDGFFANQERAIRRGELVTDTIDQIEDVALKNGREEPFAEALVAHGEEEQQRALFWDDTSAAVLGRVE